jgi:hypothetical protein
MAANSADSRQREGGPQLQHMPSIHWSSKELGSTTHRGMNMRATRILPRCNTPWLKLMSTKAASRECNIQAQKQQQQQQQQRPAAAAAAATHRTVLSRLPSSTMMTS